MIATRAAALERQQDELADQVADAADLRVRAADDDLAARPRRGRAGGGPGGRRARAAGIRGTPGTGAPRRPGRRRAARPRGPSPASSCRRRPARSSRRACGAPPRTIPPIAASAGAWPRVRAPSIAASRPRRSAPCAGRAASSPGASARRRPRRRLGRARRRRLARRRPLLRGRRVGVGPARRPPSRPSMRPACGSPSASVRVGRRRRSRGLGRRPGRGRLAGRLRLRRVDLRRASAGRQAAPSAGRDATGLLAICAMSCASSSGGTSLHSSLPRRGAGARHRRCRRRHPTGAGRGRTSGPGARRLPGVRPLTSG